MNTDITENLFQSIDTIIQARLGNLSYDKTIQCEVISIDKGNIQVQYQAAIFKASTLISNIKVGDIVYVTVPQGDFKQDKIIIAKKIQDEIEVVKTLPFLSFVKGNNLFSTMQSTGEYSIAVNTGAQTSGRPFLFTSFNQENIIAGYTRLGVKVTINSEITTNLVSGDYGLKITIQGYDQSKTHLAQAQARQNLINKIFYLKKEDMISTNIYNTHGYQNQEKVIDITNWVIDSITVELWQDNNFIDIYGNPIDNHRIFFSNLQLYLGFDISEFQESDSRLFIYTYDGLLYSSADPSFYKKEIYSRIITKQKDNTYIDSPNLYGANWSYIWEYYNPSNSSISLNSLKRGYENIAFTGNGRHKELSGPMARILSVSNAQTRNGFIFILQNPANPEIQKFVSNELLFINEAYAGSGEEEVDEESLTSFFTVDTNGYVYLGSSATNAKPLTIENIILKGELTIQGQELIFKAEDGTTVLFTIDKSGQGKFLGSATSASNFSDTSGTIYRNFEAIKNAIQNGTNYNIIMN